MRGFLVLSCLLGVASTAQAQQVQTYDYDVHGRLVSVSSTTAGATQTTTYSLDGADNRSKVVATSGTTSSLSIATAVPDETEAETVSASGQGEVSGDPRLAAVASNEAAASVEPPDPPAAGA